MAHFTVTEFLSGRNWRWSSSNKDDRRNRTIAIQVLQAILSINESKMDAMFQVSKQTTIVDERAAHAVAWQL